MITPPQHGLNRIEYHKFGDLWVHPEYQGLLAENNLCDFDALLRTSGERQLSKRGLAKWRERLALTLSSPTGKQRFFLKRYSCPPLGQRLKALLTNTPVTAKAERHWVATVVRLGIEAPMPVAYGIRRTAWRDVNSLLLTAALPGESLERWLPARANQLDRPARLRLCDLLAEMTAKLHNAGLVHRDLYLSHIFVDCQSDGACRLFLLDLQRVLQPRWRLRRWVVKDLASLNYSAPRSVVTQADRMRWLKRYLGKKKLSTVDRALIRAIVRKTGRIARHSIKHGLG